MNNKRIKKENIIKKSKLTDEPSGGPLWLQTYLSPQVTYIKKEDSGTGAVVDTYTAVAGTFSSFQKDCKVPSLYTITTISSSAPTQKYETGSTIPAGTKFEANSTVVFFY